MRPSSVLTSTVTVHEQLLNAVGQAVVTFDPTGRIAYWNRAAEEIYGWSPDEVLGRCLLDIISPESSRDAAEGVVKNLRTSGNWKSGSYLVRRRDGSARPLLILDAPLLDELGDLAAVICVSGISQEPHIETVPSANDAVLETCEWCPRSPTGSDTVRAGPTVVPRHAGGPRGAHGGDPRSADDPHGGCSGDYRGADDLCRAGDSRSADDPRSADDLRSAADTRETDDRSHAHYARDVDSRIEAYARRRAESALRKSEALYRTMVDTAHEGVWLLDSEARTTFVNASMAAMLGYSAEEMAGRVFLDFVDEEDRAAGADRFSRRTQGISESYDIRFRRSDGSVIWALISGSPFYDDAGRFAGSLGLLSDITSRKHYEQGLIEAKEKAEELAHLKSALLTNMSHEIRTPLTGILGFAEMIASVSSGDVREYAEFINQSGERLLETLNSVLELAQLESRSMRLCPEPIDIAQHAGELLPAFEGFADSKGLYLRMENGQPNLISTVDRCALSRVLANLVNNGLKFTDRGGVTVRIGKEGDFVRIEVADTGIGIDAAIVPKLFDDFKQASEGISRSYEGIGLGLSITKRLVDLMNGTVDVASVCGAGSTFTVRLPMDPPLVGSSRSSPAQSTRPNSA